MSNLFSDSKQPGVSDGCFHQLAIQLTNQSYIGRVKNGDVIFLSCRICVKYLQVRIRWIQIYRFCTSAYRNFIGKLKLSYLFLATVITAFEKGFVGQIHCSFAELMTCSGKKHITANEWSVIKGTFYNRLKRVVSFLSINRMLTVYSAAAAQHMEQ